MEKQQSWAKMPFSQCPGSCTTQLLDNFPKSVCQGLCVFSSLFDSPAHSFKKCLSHDWSDQQHSICSVISGKVVSTGYCLILFVNHYLALGETFKWKPKAVFQFISLLRRHPLGQLAVAITCSKLLHSTFKYHQGFLKSTMTFSGVNNC